MKKIIILFLSLILLLFGCDSSKDNPLLGKWTGEIFSPYLFISDDFLYVLDKEEVQSILPYITFNVKTEWIFLDNGVLGIKETWENTNRVELLNGDDMKERYKMEDISLELLSPFSFTAEGIYTYNPEAQTLFYQYKSMKNYRAYGYPEYKIFEKEAIHNNNPEKYLEEITGVFNDVNIVEEPNKRIFCKNEEGTAISFDWIGE